MKTKKLEQFFNDCGFNVNIEKEGKSKYAELERWTDGGVDMIITLNPFTVESFREYVNDFDVDELIDMHRQEKLYRDNFTISQSLHDFTAFHNELKEMLNKLEVII